MKQPDYLVSKKIGRYVGPVLTVLFLSELVTLRIYETPANAHIVYLNGFVLLLFGFYLVSIHNIWTRHWPILITLSAWGASVLGLFRLFFPTATQAPVDISTYVVLVFLAAIEMFITIKSYQR
jgi:hypothetical protein